MSTKVKLSISSVVSTFVRPGTPSEIRLSGCRAAEDMASFDRVTLLFCLSKDTDPLIKNEAIKEFDQLPEAVFSEYSAAENAHPLIVDFISGLIRNRSAVDAAVEDQADSSDVTSAVVDSGTDLPETGLPEDVMSAIGALDSLDESSEDDLVDEQGEEFLSKYKIAQMMGIGEKIKMALSGDKEWRSILIKDTNKLVSGSVIKNPRITEAEVLKLIKGGVQNDEIMRLICANKEWIKSYQIRKSLIENNRTPVQNAIRYLATMSEKDLASFAKSKNITSVISTMAKRMLLNKKK